MRQVSHAGRARLVISGVVERVVTAHLQQPWEGSECVPTLQGQRGSYGRQPSLASLTKRMRVAVSEGVSLAQPTHQGKGANFMPLCSREPPWRQSARGPPGHRLSKNFSTAFPKHQRNFVRQPVSRWLTITCEDNQKTWVKGIGRACHHAVMPRRDTNGLKRKNRRWSWLWKAARLALAQR
jgi:hypothetical protein